MVPETEMDDVRMALVTAYNFSSYRLNYRPATNHQEREEMSGLIWIVLFSLLMLVSLVTNTIYTTAVLITPRKRTVPHMLACVLFLINLVDYGLLIFEFSLGMNQQFPYSETSCVAYQTILQCSPLFTASVLAVMVYSASHKWDMFSMRTASILMVTAGLVFVVCIPSVLYSGMAIYPSGARYCVVDLGGVAHYAGLRPDRQQAFTALFYLMYRSILPYLLPLFLLAIPCVRLYKRVNGPEDKMCTGAITVCAVVSYFVFYSCLAALIFFRQTMEISGIGVSSRSAWILSVLQSLFLLLTTFQHVFRPLLCLSTDIDLRTSFTMWTRRTSKKEYVVVQSVSNQV